MKSIVTVVILFLSGLSFSQNDSIFERLQAIKGFGTNFYHLDGYSIKSQTIYYPFTEKSLKKAYRSYSIKKKIPKTKDAQLPFNNYYITIDSEITEKLVQYVSYYFMETKDDNILVIEFISTKKRNKNFERRVVTAIIEDSIPKEKYISSTTDSINFAGRTIKLGSICNWMSVNNVQCPYYGQMNWGIHKDLATAKNAIDLQLELTKSRKGGKVISEELIDIEFEGVATKAKKVIYDITGINSLLVGLSGGKTLNIYYVATEVRGYYMSCVLSFWNNDTITENGLAPLLDKVMKLKS